MPRYVFDIETRGLLPNLSQPSDLFIITAIDIDSGERFAAKLDECEDLAKRLYQADQLIGHNILGFDLPALQLTLGWWDRLEDPRDFDTMIAGRLIWSNLYNEDFAVGPSNPLPKRLYGSHSLKAYGMRLGVLKDDYEGGFDAFNEEMFVYAKQDAEVTLALYNAIRETNYATEALDLEHAVARIMCRQERTGFAFDRKAAEALRRDLMAAQADLQADLQAAFGSWEIPGELFTPKANNSKLGYQKGVTTRKPAKTVVFNPGSRDHIANRLSALYGWKPKAFTASGRPKIDETILLDLYKTEGWACCKQLADNFIIEKRLGQLSDGPSAWLKKVNTETGRIHGQVITNGAVSGRATHRIIANIPGNRAPYGEACRTLFTAPQSRVLVGSDASGLELRTLAHFLAMLGDTGYAEDVVNGDIHTRNQQAAGLPSRDQAKTFIYALLYGGGDAKIGSIVGGGPKEGAALKAKFFEAIPALRQLIATCQAYAKPFDKQTNPKGRGFLRGLDGRRLHSRSAHSALNLLLQSAGALLCKRWLVEMDRLFNERELDVQWHTWIHDEVQLSCPEDQAEKVGLACQDAIRSAQRHFDFQCQLDADFKVGTNWSETH